MNAKFPLILVLCGTIGLVSAGCTFPSKGTLYDRRSVGQSMTVEAGDIVAVRDVQVSGRSTIIGTGGGGLVGGAAASGIGTGGVGTAVASAAGAVGGAIIGEATEEAATRKNAQELTIKLGGGNTIAVIQKIATDGAFAVGEHVQVMQGGMETIVRRF